MPSHDNDMIDSPEITKEIKISEQLARRRDHVLSNVGNTFIARLNDINKFHSDMARQIQSSLQYSGVGPEYLGAMQTAFLKACLEMAAAGVIGAWGHAYTPKSDAGDQDTVSLSPEEQQRQSQQRQQTILRPGPKVGGKL